MSEKTIEWSRGRWPSLLTQFGVDSSHLSGKHGPCPLCEGKDRFRFDDKESRGTWYCNNCGAGDGMDLLMRFNGWDFQTAAGAIDKMRGQDVPRETFKEPVNYQRRRQQLNEVWSAGKYPQVLEQYFVNERGFPASVLDHLSGELRGHGSLELFEDGELKGRFPAVLAMIKDLAGNPLSIHRTYMVGSDRGKEKKIMPGMANITGAAVRLINNTRALVVGEGIETTLAGWLYLNHHVQLPYELGAWAAISAHGLKELNLPETLESIWICMDADFSFAGQAAAYELARRVKTTGRTVKILEPTSLGSDIDDVWADGDVSII